jgi:hypothetical protein
VLTLLFAAPLLVMAVVASNRGFAAPGLLWIEHRASIATSGPGFTRLPYVYPPLPVLLSLILPRDGLSLAICTCLFSGLTASILLRRIGLMRSVVLGLPLVLVPQMWYASSELLPQVAALTFLAIALQGFIRFTAYGETYGGFIAGLALAISSAADPGALLYAGVMCLFVPLIGTGRHQGEPQALPGIGAVLVFPCVAMAGIWSFLLWKFTGHWPGNLAYAPNADVFGFAPGVLAGLGHALTTAAQDLACSVLYIVAAVLLCLRRRTLTVGLGLVLPVLALALALWLGFDYPPITAYYVLALLAITVIAEFRLMDNPVFAVVIIIAALAQVAVAIKWLPATPGYTTWEHLMFH